MTKKAGSENVFPRRVEKIYFFHVDLLLSSTWVKASFNLLSKRSFLWNSAHEWLIARGGGWIIVTQRKETKKYENAFSSITKKYVERVKKIRPYACVSKTNTTLLPGKTNTTLLPSKTKRKTKKNKRRKTLEKRKKHQKLEWAGSHSNILRIKLERQQIGNLECVDDLGKQLLLWTKSRDCGK